MAVKIGNKAALRRINRAYRDENNESRRKLEREKLAARINRADPAKARFEQFLSDNKVEFIKELKFCKDRKFRFDYAIPSLMIAIEIEGGLFVKGRHSNPLGMKNDMIKYNLAALHGWTVIRFPMDELAKWHDWILKFIEARGSNEA